MPRWLIVTLSIVAMGLLGLTGLMFYKGTSPSEVAVLLFSDGVVQLREEMRPARPAGSPRVLVLALDGVGAREFQDLLGRGGMPHVAALLGAEMDATPGLYEHGLASSGVWSVLPSTTFAAWTAVYTGAGVAASGVSGNEWFDRESMAFVAPAPVSVTEHADAVRVYTDSLMHRWMAVPTVFEQADVRSYVTLAAQYRGADLLIRPDSRTFAELVSGFAAGAAAGETDRESYSSLDVMAVDRTLDAIEEHGLADLQVVYFPGVDLFTHVAESAIPDQQQYLSEVVDPAIERLLDGYRSRGALDSTYVLLVSDHGHTPSLADERHALGTGGEGEPAGALEAIGFRVRPFKLETDDDDYQAVLAYQGALAYVHLADRSTCPEPEDPCDWQVPPRFEEDVMAVVRVFDEAARTGQHAWKLEGAIDLIFAREPRGVESAGPYLVWNGEALVAVDAYLAANPRPDLVNLAERLDAMAVGRYGHRSGDVMLLARSREEDPVTERYYFSAIYRSWHGSPSRQDSEILFALARPDSTGTALREQVHAAVGETPSQLDVTPLILTLLGR